MGGNVCEWGESAFDGGEPTAVSRGCSAAATGTALRTLQSSIRNALPDIETRFRFSCRKRQGVAVPEPSSVGLLVIGAMGCMLRRKRG